MDHAKAAAMSLVVCGASLLVGCKHPPVALGHDVKVVCIESDDDLHLKKNKTTFQFGRSLVPTRFRLKEWKHVDFPWDHARYLERLECKDSYTWSGLQNSDYQCHPAAAAELATSTESKSARKKRVGSGGVYPCESTCKDDPYRRVQGYVKLHPEGDKSSSMVRHCVQLFDIAAGDGKKAGVLMMLYHPEDSAHAGYAHGEEQ
jgi:hypothetical protein